MKYFWLTLVSLLFLAACGVSIKTQGITIPVESCEDASQIRVWDAPYAWLNIGWRTQHIWPAVHEWATRKNVRVCDYTMIYQDEAVIQLIVRYETKLSVGQ